jgi:hypothetical protein
MAYTTIDKPDDYFNTILYTGTGGTQSITGVGFQPDWVWLKARSFAYSHQLFDVIRGATKLLASEETSAEQTLSGVTSFDSDGFSVGSDAGSNNSGTTFVSWNWLANGAGVSNTDGSITSTVSANTTSGFSIVTRTGTGANASVGHGLGVAPSMIITKVYSTAGNDWMVYHKSLGATNYIKLNLTDGTFASSAVWNNTAPDSDKFYLGSSGDANASGQTSVAYCFADVKGFSKFGSYTGNGSTDGTFVYTGFKPAFVMTKSSSTGGTYYDWGMMDNKRANPFNVIDAQVCANLSDEENSANIGSQKIDFLSNGFKPRANGSSHNDSGVTYIYMAFAENPFVTSTGIPTTAR